MEPMKPEAKIATLAAPPRKSPPKASARSLKKAAPPVRCSTAPKRTKPITRLPKAFMGVPKEASKESMLYAIASQKGDCAPEINGMCEAKVGKSVKNSTKRKIEVPPARRVASGMSRIRTSETYCAISGAAYSQPYSKEVSAVQAK